MEYVTAIAAVSNAMPKVNHALLVYFLKATETMDFRAHFNIYRIHMNHFLYWIMFWTSNAVPANIIADVMRTKASALLKALKLTMFASFSDPDLQKIGIEQVWQTLQASLLVVTYAVKDPLEHKFFYTLFRAGHSPVALINGALFV